MKNVLVTGGAGFIGSNLIDVLLEYGYKVITIDNFDSFYSESIKMNNINNAINYCAFKLIRGDIRNSEVLDICFEKNKIDLVIHLAAKAGVRPSIKNPPEYFDVNVNGTLNLLEAMRKYDVKKMIFASSSSIYGNNFKIPFSEYDNVDYPISPYAATKKAGELLCHTYHHLYNFDIFCLRFFTAYGPRQRPDLAIHKFIRLINEGKPIQIFGDGTSKRDYTYIDDIIGGMLLAIAKLNGFEIINIGESQTIALNELVYKIEGLLEKKAIIDWQQMQLGDVLQTYADISKATSLLGYSPSTNIEIGLKKQIQWLNAEL